MILSETESKAICKKVLSFVTAADAEVTLSA